MDIFAWIEGYLDSTGRFKLSKYVRYLQTMFMSDESLEEQREWAMFDDFVDWQRIAIAQRETYLKEEIAAWRATAQASKMEADQQPVKIKNLKKELKMLDKKYRVCERAQYEHRLQKPHGPITRDYDTRRELLMKGRIVLGSQCADCTENGGCCSRDCKCCLRPRNTHREPRYSHCTRRCGCCVRFYDLEPDSEDENSDLETYCLI